MQSRVGIQRLPVELVQKIHVDSRSSALPIVCRYFRQACQSASSQTKAEYIFARWFDRLVQSTAMIPCHRKHRACKSLASRIAAIDSQSAPVEITDCAVNLIRENHLDIITIAAEFGISTVKILKRVVNLAKISLPLSLAELVLPPLERSQTTKTGASMWLPQLPKRLFRRIDQTVHQTRPKKRRKLRDGATVAEEQKVCQEEEEEPPLAATTRSRAELKKLAWRIAKAPPLFGVDTLKEADRSKLIQRDGQEAHDLGSIAESTSPNFVGPVPSADDLDMILTLLLFYSADGSSHQGYPLAMAVHRRAYALSHLLLLFGADPHCKDELAVQIAIRNGSQAILDLFVTGPSDSTYALDVPHCYPSPSATRRLRLNHTHLELAIASRQTDLIDYIWHEQNVTPNMACLRLIEKIRR